jgi:hypothetical protein
MSLHRAVLLLLCAAGSAAAQQGPLLSEAWSGSFDVRNRWVTDIGGSSQTYRSIVNLGAGPRLFDGDLHSRPGAVADEGFVTLNPGAAIPTTPRISGLRRGLRPPC